MNTIEPHIQLLKKTIAGYQFLQCVWV